MGTRMSLLEDANRAEQVRIFKRISSIIVPNEVRKEKKKKENKKKRK